MALFRLGERVPAVDPSAYVAESAEVIGSVTLGAGANVWPTAVLRGDNEPIGIGAGSNVQEGAVLHTDPGFPLTVGAGVTIGHQAMLHGCNIGAGSLIGIKAVVLNGAMIGRDCIVGAGALVTEGKSFPDRSLIVGVPGKVVRALTDEDVARMRRNTDGYVRRAAFYKTALEKIDG